MEVSAKIDFLKISRPPYTFRYFGKGCWMRMDSNLFNDLPCVLGFEEGKEFYDEDSTEVIIGLNPEDERTKK
ncbi:hypothetical protein JYB88_00025 [Shewanella cyperi]|uniref:Uncharacterized protein n=1 Tax=Shewanella cyperi TaxID=2814292 RepID=A0A974XMS8_9GAMM|nr:hypothetical protein [Shewanella cyperi]QSX30113.1 hypothetical protein JYB88_00025 [Shewanella cyperi]